MLTLNVLISALSSLKKTDIHEFEKFLKSPYFIKKHAHTSQSLQLLRIIKNTLVKKIKYPSIEECINLIFKNADRKNLKEKANRLISDFHSYFIEFLSFEQFKRSKPFQKLFLLQEFIDKNLIELMLYHNKAKYFNLQNFDDKEIEAFYYLKLFSLENKFKSNTGINDDEVDYEIEFGLLEDYYNILINQIFTRSRIRYIRHNMEKVLI